LRANSTIELTRSLAFAGGPAVAGAVIGWVGAKPALGLAIASSGLAMTLLLTIPSRVRQPVSHRANLTSDLLMGARWTLRHPLLRPIMITAVVFNTAWFCLQGVFVAYAITNLRFSESQVGWTLASYGVGMIAGASISRAVFRRLSVGTAIRIGPCAGLAAIAIMCANLMVQAPLAPAIAYFLLGAGPILWTISTTTLRQSVTPLDLLGRVSAMIVTATAGARPLGAILGAVAATSLGVEWALLLSLLGMGIQASVILTSPVARLTAYPEEGDVSRCAARGVRAGT
jgi:predicted MFS family arabinose efflux permease